MPKTKYDIVVFDCDSTLTKIEGINELARLKGKEKEVAALTTKAMNGELDFKEALRKRLDLIKPEKKDLKWLAQRYVENEVKDAKKLITILKQLGVKVCIITGAYREAVQIFAESLGVKKENVFAVDLKFGKNEDYLGYDYRNPLTKNDGKRKVLQGLAKKGRILFVGDGATDLAAKDEVDLFVGFGGVVKRLIVKKYADVFLEQETLLPVLDLVLGDKGKHGIIKRETKG